MAAMQTILTPFPAARPRRLRRDDFSRRLVAEHRLDASDFIYPVFVMDGDGARQQDVPSMPGVVRHTIEALLPVAERCQQLGIPVLIDRSSYEDDPLGRLEWIRIYGLLTGTEEKAQEAFLSQAAQVEDASFAKDLGTVAIFAVNSNHQITTRRQNDYLSKMIQKAGGTYLAPGTDDDGRSLSQATISLEAFYAYAKDADILIYNATIEEAPESIEKLVEKDALLRDFDAVKNGAVWVMEPSIYQYSDRTGTIIRELNQVLSSGDPSGGSTTFFRKLQ